MKINKTDFSEVLEITVLPVMDSRGFFVRTYDKEIFAKYKIGHTWVQENKSLTKKAGTIRGLHFQFPPFTEAKLVSVLNGKIFDVILDLRSGSDTFGQYYSTVISKENNKSLIVPRGFAHGFCSLEDNTEVCYKVDNYYHPQSEGGIVWDDSTINIQWPIDNPIISSKDKNLFTFRDFVLNHNSIKLKD